jgi:hypothetical protein
MRPAGHVEPVSAQPHPAPEPPDLVAGLGESDPDPIAAVRQRAAHPRQAQVDRPPREDRLGGDDAGQRAAPARDAHLPADRVDRVAGVLDSEKQHNKINEGLTGVTATVEVAGPESKIKVNTLALLFEVGTALSLPLKIKLDNVLLGSHCYIGSDSEPIVIDFTSGETSPPPPNEPIHGSAGTFESNEAETLFTLSGGQLVNNPYGAPEANGCGGIFSFFIDPLVNSLLELPSPPGTNTAVLEGVLKSAEAAAVKASEE